MDVKDFTTGRQPVTGHSDPDGDMRVFAIQYRLNIDHAESYATYRAAMRELVESLVLPHVVPGRPTLVVFPEAVGLPAVAIGARGEAFRQMARDNTAPLAEIPSALAGAMQVLGAEYAPQIGAYYGMFGELDPRSQLFLATTDTTARAFVQTFSDIATDYGIYVVAGNYQPAFRATTDPDEVAAFGDPECADGVAYVAKSASVTNSTFLWGPNETDPQAVAGERNLLFRNEKIPLTEMELDFLGLDNGPSTGEESVRNAGWVEVEGFRLGFATSLPAFAYGYPFGQRPADFDPIADLNERYAAAQNDLAVEVMIQADANSGPWAWPVASGAWQPLEWMSSVWRAVADPSANFRYNVTPMMTGNLFDLMFDGQSSITSREYAGQPASFVGNCELAEADPEEYFVYAQPKPEFLACSSWIVPDAAREDLVQLTGALSPGSGTPLENAYVETAIFADLVRAR